MSAPAAWGAPDDPGTVADSPTLSLADLGNASVLTFWGQEGAVQLTVPVPPGLTLGALNATVQLPINLRSGILTVTQGDRTLSKVNLPTTDQAPIGIPLDGAEVIDNWATVIVHSYLQQSDGNTYCDHSSPLRLFNGTINFAGVEQPPSTLAHFLPPVLRKLTIYLPQSPSPAESDAAIRLVAAATAHYGTQAPEIDVLPLTEGQVAPPTPPRPLERQVVIKEGPENGLALRGTAHRWLLISGSLDRTDESDIALLFGDLRQLALAPKAFAESLRSSPRLPGDTTTLRDLGQSGFNVGALQPRISIGLDQTRFGRSFHSVRVHLLGSYSPTPGNSGGEIVATVGSEIVERWPTDGQGAIDRWIQLPDRLLQRYTSLDVQLNIAGNIGPCGDFSTVGPGAQMLSLAINGDSSVQSSPAAPPIPDGLRSMPQALMPRIQVGIEPHSFGDTVRAVALIAGLQRISAIPLDTAVTSVQKAIDSQNPAILIAGDGWNHPDIVLPVSAGSRGPITVNTVESDGKPARLTLDPTFQFASVQTVFDRGRSLLIATSNGVPGQLDELLRWLGSDTAHWAAAKGVALVSAQGQDPVAVERVGGDEPAASHSGLGWLWWLGAGWLAVAVVGVGAIVLRSRRGSPRR